MDGSERELTTAHCGCGEYVVHWPKGQQPPAIDVVCPECRNHFGHGEIPCRHEVDTDAERDEISEIEPYSRIADVDPRKMEEVETEGYRVRVFENWDGSYTAVVVGEYRHFLTDKSWKGVVAAPIVQDESRHVAIGKAIQAFVDEQNEESEE